MLAIKLFICGDGFKSRGSYVAFFHPPSVEYNMIKEQMFDNYADDIYKLDSKDTDRQCELFSDKVSCWWQLPSNILQGIPAQHHKNQPISEAI